MEGVEPLLTEQALEERDRLEHSGVNARTENGTSSEISTGSITSLYPNPFGKTFMVNTTALDPQQTYYLRLHTTVGVLVHQQELSPAQTQKFG